MSLFLFLLRDSSSRNTPPWKIRVGEYFISGLFCLQRKHLAYEYFLTFCFSLGGVVSTSPKPKLEDHPLSAVRDYLFNLFAATFHIGSCSSICNLRMRHAVVTGTHKHKELSLYRRKRFSGKKGEIYATSSQAMNFH